MTPAQRLAEFAHELLELLADADPEDQLLVAFANVFGVAAAAALAGHHCGAIDALVAYAEVDAAVLTATETDRT